MPFIPQSRREQLDQMGYQPSPGDRCYRFYKNMMDQWRCKRRWSTAHNIYAKMRVDLSTRMDDEDCFAYELAWQVFFTLQVVPYELEKRAENGDVY